MITTLVQQLIALLIVSFCFFGSNGSTSTLIISGAGCKTQAKNFGEISSADECAMIVTRAAVCAEGTFMFSSTYPSWGCRCCSATEGGAPNNNWNVYSIYSATLAFPDYGCKSQAKNFGTLKNAEQCATKVANEPLCSKGSFMFSNTYPSWGCRCCSVTEGGNPNVNWEIYSLYSATLAYPQFGCKSQAKNFGTLKTAAQCAALVGSDPLCSKGSFMFSKSYPSWGCRCCSATEDGPPNVNWDIYSIYSAELAIAGHGCKGQAKNMGTTKSADQCASLVGSDPVCTERTFMFSKSYPSWGCRCCSETVGAKPNVNWDVFHTKGSEIGSGSAALEYFDSNEEFGDEDLDDEEYFGDEDYFDSE